SELDEGFVNRLEYSMLVEELFDFGVGFVRIEPPEEVNAVARQRGVRSGAAKQIHVLLRASHPRVRHQVHQAKDGERHRCNGTRSLQALRKCGELDTIQTHLNCHSSPTAPKEKAEVI